MDESRWLPDPLGPGGVKISLTRPTPTRDAVSSWYKIQKKRQLAQSNDCLDGPKRHKTAAKEATIDMELDGNSRKLVIAAMESCSD